MITIQSPRLKVEIAEPGTVYQRTRFDWSAFITQVTLDGAHTFCVPESYEAGKGTGGVGLCNEFGIETAVGYADAEPGECFPKLGIGLLKKIDDAPYGFIPPFEIVEKFPIDIEIQADSVRFVVGPVACRGYAARLTKHVGVRADELEIGYLLENTGEKAIRTQEYCHNFVGIDAQPIGPDYRLRFPYALAFEDQREMMKASIPAALRELPEDELNRRIQAYLESSRAVLNIAGQDFSLHAIPDKDFYCRLAGAFATDLPQWELAHLASGVWMREYDDFAPSRVAVWGTSHVISPEIFIDIDLQPGQQMSWKRRYQFGC